MLPLNSVLLNYPIDHIHQQLSDNLQNYSQNGPCIRFGLVRGPSGIRIPGGGIFRK